MKQVNEKFKVGANNIYNIYFFKRVMLNKVRVMDVLDLSKDT